MDRPLHSYRSREIRGSLQGHDHNEVGPSSFFVPIRFRRELVPRARVPIRVTTCQPASPNGRQTLIIDAPVA
jgi:hypothetical protein